eukprot:gene18237-23287_t
MSAAAVATASAVAYVTRAKEWARPMDSCPRKGAGLEDPLYGAWYDWSLMPVSRRLARPNGPRFSGGRHDANEAATLRDTRSGKLSPHRRGGSIDQLSPLLRLRLPLGQNDWAPAMRHE